MAKLLTTDEVATILRVKAHTVREIVKRGDLKAIKVSNRLIRIDEDELKAYLKRLEKPNQ